MRTIVMTGGTSGIGAVAATRLRTAPGVRLVVGGRTTADGVRPLDLARLDSVRAFADAITGPVDALVLNAGVSFHRGDRRTPDGYETTFAVNHLGQYLLLRLLSPRLVDGARVVITTSSTHDPRRDRILPPARHADVARLARPETDPERDTDPRTAGGRAYTTSKLCNVLTARALAAAGHGSLTVIAFDPGPTPGTGLSREFGPALRAAWAVLGSPIGRLVPRLSSPELAGGTLAALALGEVVPPRGAVYASIVRGRLTWPEPSELARDDAARDALWRDSAALVGLTG